MGCHRFIVAGEALEQRRMLHYDNALSFDEAATPPVNAAGTIYVDVGNTVAQYVDAAGSTTWSTDAGFAGGKRVRGRFAVDGTDDDALFTTRRQGLFAYTVPAPDGAYTLSLLFVDTMKKAGRRLFNVDAEGQRLETALDIAARVGRRAALVVSHEVTVTGGALDLAFTRVRGKAVLSGISLVPFAVQAPAPPTPDPEPDPDPPPPPPPPAPGAPAAPSNLSAAAQSSTSVVLSWTDNSNDETAFVIERATNTGGFAELATLPAGATQHADVTVSPGNTYAYRVRATGAGGPSPYSNPASATPVANVRWETGAAAPVALGEVAGGVIDGKLYLLGAGSGQTFAYDIAQDTWTSGLATRPHVGEHHAAEVVNGKLYLFGGFNGGSSGKVQIYNPASDSWTLGAAMPFPTGSASSALIGGKVYVAGGIVNFQPNVGGQTTTQAAVYDPANDTWDSIAPMPRGANHAASATDGSRLYVFAGRDGAGGVLNGFDTVQIYDPATDAWRSSDVPGSGVAPIPQARGGMGKAVFANGEFYVIGGETLTGAGATPDDVYDRVDVYNPATNAWRQAPPMPTARHGIFPLLHENRIYVATGGVRAAGSQSRLLEILILGH